MVAFGGDFRFFWPESIKDFVSFPSAWDSSLNTGLGQSQLPSLWITSYFNFTTFFTKLGLDWNLIQILFWILPAFVISFFSSFFLFKHLFKETKFSIISGLIYSLNTYFLLVLTGGQLGVSLAYSLVPLVFLRFIKLFDNSNIKNSILTGLVLSLQIIFDPRIVYITLVVVLFYSLLNFPKLNTIKNKLILLAPFIIAVLLNIFWILPLVLTKSSAIPVGFDSVSGFKFFSFAEFSNSLSLLHPNWPENIFGKVYFLDPKFLILPILAFSSLLLTKNKNIVFFSILSLLGVFFAKGVNPPFGEVNNWLFQNVPGMSMFRDPTKWYILVALSYSLLIPFSLIELSRLVQRKMKFSIFNFKFTNYLYLLFPVYFLLLIVPIFGQIKVQQVPQEYVQLKDFLVKDNSFSRTLWVPKWQRFGYFSNNHPAIGREELFQGTADEQVSKLRSDPPLPEIILSQLSVKYIIVPYDSEGEIFLKNRRYSEKEFKDTVERLKKISWLKEIQGFDKLKVFEISNPEDHFWGIPPKVKVKYEFLNPTEYEVNVKNVKKGDILVFSEGFDKNWVAEGKAFTIQSSPGLEGHLNRFKLPLDGAYNLRIVYKPQKYVKAGMAISLISFAILLGFLKFGYRRRKW